MPAKLPRQALSPCVRQFQGFYENIAEYVRLYGVQQTTYLVVFPSPRFHVAPLRPLKRQQ
jgi:hypothetical protein